MNTYIVQYDDDMQTFDDARLAAEAAMRAAATARSVIITDEQSYLSGNPDRLAEVERIEIDGHEVRTLTCRPDFRQELGDDALVLDKKYLVEKFAQAMEQQHDHDQPQAQATRRQVYELQPHRLHTLDENGEKKTASFRQGPDDVLFLRMKGEHVSITDADGNRLLWRERDADGNLKDKRDSLLMQRAQYRQGLALGAYTEEAGLVIGRDNLDGFQAWLDQPATDADRDRMDALLADEPLREAIETARLSAREQQESKAIEQPQAEKDGYAEHEQAGRVYLLADKDGRPIDGYVSAREAAKAAMEHQGEVQIYTEDPETMERTIHAETRNDQVETTTTHLTAWRDQKTLYVADELRAEVADDYPDARPLDALEADDEIRNQAQAEEQEPDLEAGEQDEATAETQAAAPSFMESIRDYQKGDKTGSGFDLAVVQDFVASQGGAAASSARNSFAQYLDEATQAPAPTYKDQHQDSTALVLGMVQGHTFNNRPSNGG